MIPLFGATIDLSGTVIVDDGEDPVTSKSALMLQEELAKRSGITLSISKIVPSQGSVIHLGTTTSTVDEQVLNAKDAYRNSIDGRSITLLGRDPRGTMFATYSMAR